MRDKGFAFVTFGSGADVQLALHAYKEHFIDAKWIEVKPMLLSKARSGGGSSGGASAAGAHAGWDGLQDRHRSDGGRAAGGGVGNFGSGRYSDETGWGSANKPEWGGNSSWGGCSGGESHQASWKGRGDSW